MYKRVLYKALEDHLDSKLITVVTGMRRVGKTTAVKYLLEKVAHDNKAYIDFEKIEHRHIFMQSSYKEVQIESKSNAAFFYYPRTNSHRTLRYKPIPMYPNIPGFCRSRRLMVMVA